MRNDKIVLTILSLFFFVGLSAQQAPKPVGLTPNERQIDWFQQEIIAFFHFGINTYENFVNEGDGKTTSALFCPTALDCRQWGQTLKNAGILNGILTVKHADGFCLWPSAYTDYSVKNSSWKNGNGDVVKEFTDAFNAMGLRASVYLGPHDRHEHLSPSYNTTDYRDYYANQLTELLSNYGQMWETWWDGAGADELTTQIYSKWAEIVRRLQPQSVIFGTKNSYCFADVRWNGNEAGIAGDPCWATIDSSSIRDETAHIKELNEGQVNGNAYIPAESDVSIRPSWFYHAEEDTMVKSVKELWDIYCKSVGRNSVLLLNLPPNRRGLIHPIDSANVVGLRKVIDETFKNNLLEGATVIAKNIRGDAFKASNMVDKSPSTYYAGRDNVATDEIVFEMNSVRAFDCLMIQELIELGHRTTEWSVDYSQDGKGWTVIPEAKNKRSIGHKWIIRFPPVRAKYVRLRITKGNACPAIHTFGVYKQSSLLYK
ncbi:MAG: alpha-L-fucosidase [Bacteroidales bacterium]